MYFTLKINVLNFKFKIHILTKWNFVLDKKSVKIYLDTVFGMFWRYLIMENKHLTLDERNLNVLLLFVMDVLKNILASLQSIITELYLLSSLTRLLFLKLDRGLT